MTSAESAEFTARITERLDQGEQSVRHLLERAQSAKEHVEAYGKPGDLMPGWSDWPDVIAACHQMLRDIDAKRKLVARWSDADIHFVIAESLA
jgi:hypothetical protein